MTEHSASYNERSGVVFRNRDATKKQPVLTSALRSYQLSVSYFWSVVVLEKK
jgi:hypothetical protein